MDIRRGSHFPSLCGARILIYGLLVIDRSVHIFQSCGFDQFDNACCPSLEWSLSLGNSLCISPRGYCSPICIGSLVCLCPHLEALYQSQGSLTSPVLLTTTTPHSISIFFLIISHTPTTSHTPPPSHPSVLARSCNTAFLEHRKKDLRWSRLAQHRLHNSPRAKGDSLFREQQHAVKNQISTS